MVRLLQHVFSTAIVHGCFMCCYVFAGGLDINTIYQCLPTVGSGEVLLRSSGHYSIRQDTRSYVNLLGNWMRLYSSVLTCSKLVLAMGFYTQVVLFVFVSVCAFFHDFQGNQSRWCLCEPERTLFSRNCVTHERCRSGLLGSSTTPHRHNVNATEGRKQQEVEWVHKSSWKLTLLVFFFITQYFPWKCNNMYNIFN